MRMTSGRKSHRLPNTRRRPEAAARRQLAQHRRHRGGQLRGGRVFLERVQAGDQLRRGVLERGRGRMAALGARGDARVEDALLGHAHDGELPLHAKRRVVDDRAALVQHHIRHAPALLQQLHEVRRGVAAVLLGVRREQVHVARRHVAFRQQVLGRLQKARPDALRVHRAARVDGAVGDLGREGAVRPLGSVRAHHVVVRHEHHRRKLAVGALPQKRNAVAVDQLQFQAVEHARVQAAQQRDESVERAAVGIRVVPGPTPWGSAASPGSARPRRRRHARPRAEAGRRPAWA